MFLITRSRPALGRIALLVAMSNTAQAGGLRDTFIDDDGWFDGSKFLLEYPYAVLPVASIITEPAVGNGLVLAAAHFHERGKGVPENERDSKGRTIPRSISAAAVGATENDSWFAGGGHIGYYNQGGVRYEGLAGYADINLEFYGTIEEPNNNGFDFNAKASILWQSLAFRLWDSNWFAGGIYRFMNTESRFDFGGDIPGVDDEALDSRNAALGAVLVYDSLDNQFTPKQGILSDLQYARFDEAVGGDFNYDQVTWLNQAHITFAGKWTLGLRADLDSVDGDAPFYALPYINLKGIPALRYQGEDVLSTEARLNWTFHPRWQVAFFLGSGWTSNEGIGEINDSSSRVTRGVGFRYMGVRKLGLNLGLDFAKGPEEEVVYVSFGTRW